MVLLKTYNEPAICEKEILRYAGCKEADNSIRELLDECIEEARDNLTYKVCYRELSVCTDGKICDFEYFCVPSEKLSVNLRGCKKVIIFAATVGTALDRLIAKYNRIAPSKAVMLHAIGSERIEALCDAFCEDISSEYNIKLKPRFSPGYGDVPLSVQKSFFDLLGCEKRLGIALLDSLMMSPSKTVTAFVGLCDN